MSNIYTGQSLDSSQTPWSYEEIEISEIDRLLKEGYEIEVDSPDGYVSVNFFIDKGEFDEHVLTVEDGTQIRVNENHLFETDLGWKFARDLLNDGDRKYLTRSGYQSGKVELTGERIPIVDINVNHENHRYYTENVSSHNTGVGKSFMMCHLAASHLRLGQNVLYITLEMSEEKIGERIDENLLDLNVDDLHGLNREVFLSRIDKIKQKTQGRLKIKEYPTSSAHVGHFRALLSELKLKQNFVPDVIYVDYVNIMASSRMKMGESSYGYIKAITEELRGLAVEHNVAIITATQTNRDGINNTEVDMTSTAESMGFVHALDLYLALVSTEQLEKLNQLLLIQLKNRYNDVNNPKKFMLGMNRAKMQLFDLDSAASIMQTAAPAASAPISTPRPFTTKPKTGFTGFKV